MSEHTTTSDPDSSSEPKRRGRPPLTDDQRSARRARATVTSGDTGDPESEAAILAEHVSALVPESMRAPGWELLGQACLTFGINPDVEAAELIKWELIPGPIVNRVKTLDRVKVITAGGWKGYYPINEETEHALALVFNLYAVDKATGQTFRRSLPVDLTLPRHIVTGVSPKRDHVFDEGYLKRDRTPAEIARDVARRQASTR